MFNQSSLTFPLIPWSLLQRMLRPTLSWLVFIILNSNCLDIVICWKFIKCPKEHKFFAFLTDLPTNFFNFNVGFTRAEMSAEISSRCLHCQKKVQDLYIKRHARGDFMRLINQCVIPPLNRNIISVYSYLNWS
jgi:hypothetical protein